MQRIYSRVQNLNQLSLIVVTKLVHHYETFIKITNIYLSIILIYQKFYKPGGKVGGTGEIQEGGGEFRIKKIQTSQMPFQN